jgi:hypothetical protein
MTCKVSRVYNKIPLSSLGIFKITQYPFEERDFKPFALSRLCILNDNTLVCRMWSFEVNPYCENGEDIFNDSTMSFAFGQKDNFLIVTANAKGKVLTQKVCGGEIKTVSSNLHSHFFTGEDLQGIYWGVQFSLELEEIKKLIGIDISEGFKGNIYKTSFKEHKHFGGLFSPKTPNLFDSECFGEFEITKY